MTRIRDGVKLILRWLMRRIRDGVRSTKNYLIQKRLFNYGHKKFSQKGSCFDKENDFVIQIDDCGCFWDPSIAKNAFNKIEKESKCTNTIVLIFVHGWHHNANIKDSNSIDFSKLLNKTRKTLEDNDNGKPGVYRKSRELLTGNPDVTVIGIYIGWRGKSLPMPLDFTTFWGRKAAAERVGNGDLREFLLRLNCLYESRSLARNQLKNMPFMGLVSIGHSFGGQVLFKAVSPYIESELIRKESIQHSKSSDHSIKGFGDIMVLLNPALEAIQYERIHRINKKLVYDSSQIPRLLVLSSATDFARKIFFPIGRYFGSLFRPTFRASQVQLWIKALGEYKEHRTHEVEIVDRPNNSKPFTAETYLERYSDIIDYDLTNIPLIADVKLNPTKHHQSFSPFLVAYASGRVIYKHSGIFEDTLRRFITDYIAIVQGKQLLINTNIKKILPGK